MEIVVYKISIFLCLLGGLQGIILILALIKMYRNRRRGHRWLIILLSVTSITLVARVLYLYPDIVDERIPLLTDIILFLFGPLVYFFAIAIFGDTPKKKVKYFIPAVIHLVMTLPLFMVTKQTYLEWQQDVLFFYYFYAILVFALLHNGYFYFKSIFFLKKVEKQYQSSSIVFGVNHVSFFLHSYGLILILFLTSVVVYPLNFNLGGILYQLTWIIASWSIYSISYFVLIKSNSFGEYLIKGKKTIVRSENERLQMEQLFQMIQVKLEKEKVFLDPELSLINLAELLETNTVLLSKTINYKFQQGFYDLINKYRVNEFIELMKDPSSDHLTYFGLALKAGFNSKTSFNKYFKRITGVSPKNYFSSLEVI